VRVRTIAQNLSVEREAQSLSVYKLDVLKIFELRDPTPKLGKGSS